MATYQIEFFVRRPVGETFAALNDHSKMHNWVTGFKKIEMIEGKPDEVGSRQRLLVDDGGKTVEIVEEVITFDPKNEFSFRMDSRFIVGTTRILLRRTEDGTALTILNNVHARGLKWKLLLPFLKPLMRMQQVKDYGKFKTMLESSPTGV